MNQHWRFVNVPAGTPALTIKLGLRAKCPNSCPPPLIRSPCHCCTCGPLVRILVIKSTWSGPKNRHDPNKLCTWYIPSSSDEHSPDIICGLWITWWNILQCWDFSYHLHTLLSGRIGWKVLVEYSCMCIKEGLTISEEPKLDANAEVIWAKLSLGPQFIFAFSIAHLTYPLTDSGRPRIFERGFQLLTKERQPSLIWRPRSPLFLIELLQLKYLDWTALLEYFNYQDSNQSQKGFPWKPWNPPGSATD